MAAKIKRYLGEPVQFPSSHEVWTVDSALAADGSYTLRSLDGQHITVQPAEDLTSAP